MVCLNPYICFTLYVLTDSSFFFDRINLGWTILSFFEDRFVLATIVDPGEIPCYLAFYLRLQFAQVFLQESPVYKGLTQTSVDVAACSEGILSRNILAPYIFI